MNCHTWCNPAPTDGSAPNLVIPAVDTCGCGPVLRMACMSPSQGPQILKNV